MSTFSEFSKANFNVQEKSFSSFFLFHNDDDNNKDVFLYYHDHKIRGEEKVKIPIVVARVKIMLVFSICAEAHKIIMG
ncbi:hypothetical protein DERP_003550 [Dermatophagoides pteronyssinus]|uniref:Uncharacterized protein n=1 Tax=Dermatophagoides pteronyssinus TaxID=6956 RepID=A0ABQ8JLC3_DERPT|nr:hypothetical protein DERP_003550 [Dermatophagoides pteronyssinus]